MRTGLAVPLLFATALVLLPKQGARAAEDIGRSKAEMVLAAGEFCPCPLDRTVTVTFVAVLADSRCPTNALCVRAGGVRIELEARRGQEQPAMLVLDTDRGNGTGQACGLLFKVLRVDPLRIAGETLDPASYRITLETSWIAG